MKIKKEPLYIAADTESTQPQSPDEVAGFQTIPWALGYALVDPEGEREVVISQRVRNFLDGIKHEAETRHNVKPVVYFHNLAWDGMIILDALMRVYNYTMTENKYHPGRHEFMTMISDMGAWYKVSINWKGCEIELRDSLKILPMKLEKLCKDFNVKHQKLVGSIDYTIKRTPMWNLTEEEKRYFENDILGLAECLEIAEKEGLCDNLTIGAKCLSMYKQMLGDRFDLWFPELPEDLDAVIRRAYRGGWCFVGEKNQNKVLKNISGFVYDVNSLYPYSMHSNTWEGDRRHVYPIGLPIYHAENPDPEALEKYKDCPGFYKVAVSFNLKSEHVPFIQIKHSIYRDNEYIHKTEGVEEIYLTKEDFYLLHEQYDIDYEEIEEAWIFKGKEGIFDQYIDYWFKIKEEATLEGNKAKRTIAKLFLNNLYGKFSSSPNGAEKVPRYSKRKECIVWQMVDNVKDTVYIPAGAYVTAYARGKTVRAAQENFNVFDYADTDSLHCHGKAEGLVIDDVALGAWANESRYDAARYVRQKTYIEHITEADGKPVSPYFDIKAAGCPESVKERIQYKTELFENLKYSEDDLDKKHPLNERYSIDEMLDRFTYGLKESGKNSRKTVKGGTILYNSTFEIKPL